MFSVIGKTAQTPVILENYFLMMLLAFDRNLHYHLSSATAYCYFSGKISSSLRFKETRSGTFYYLRAWVFPCC